MGNEQAITHRCKSEYVMLRKASEKNRKPVHKVKTILIFRVTLSRVSPNSNMETIPTDKVKNSPLSKLHMLLDIISIC